MARGVSRRAQVRGPGVPLIEDAAQAFGAAEQGRALGTWGDLGIFSFGIYKHLSGWRGAFAAFYRDCPNAREASRSLVLLPTYPRYPVSEIRRNIEAIRAFFCRDARAEHPGERVTHAR